MDKNRKKELIRQYAQAQKSAFLESLPFETASFKMLFDCLDAALQNGGCDNTLKYTVKFLNENKLPMENSIAWLNENGGSCDCEVLANVEEKFSDL